MQNQRIGESLPATENDIVRKLFVASYTKGYIQWTRSSRRERTEKGNQDKDGHKLWKVTTAITDENIRLAKIAVEQTSK